MVAGQTLSMREFECVMRGPVRMLIRQISSSSGYYFTDLAYHNYIKIEDGYSLIDLESILPLEWYGRDDSFSTEHLSEIDIGWSIQSKFRSPKWYTDFQMR